MRTVNFAFSFRRARWSKLIGFGPWVGLGLMLLLLLEPGDSHWARLTVAQIALAQGTDTVYEDEVQKGTELLRRRKYEDALKSFKRANEMRDKKSPDCFYGMAQAYFGLEAYKNVVESCDKTIELSGSDNHLRAPAYNLKGLAIQAQSQGKDQKKLKDAEAAFRQGLELGGADMPILHYNLGLVLMQQSRDPEGLVELKKYVELQPSGSSADTARKMMENPRRARESYAPEFSFTTSEGEYIALEDLRGKVVLLDFWGTWCPPCVASVPSLRSLHKRYAKESLVMIGVSSDSEEATWRAFTAKNQMVWHQYLDRDQRVQRAFGVRSFPTYILIDHEGIVRFSSIGMSWDKAAYLEDAIRKQVKIVAKEGLPN